MNDMRMANLSWAYLQISRRLTNMSAQNQNEDMNHYKHQYLATICLRMKC